MAITRGIRRSHLGARLVRVAEAKSAARETPPEDAHAGADLVRLRVHVRGIVRVGVRVIGWVRGRVRGRVRARVWARVWARV